MFLVYRRVNRFVPVAGADALGPRTSAAQPGITGGRPRRFGPLWPARQTWRCDAWNVLGPGLPQGAPPPAPQAYAEIVRPRVNGEFAHRLKRRLRQVTPVAAVGPGLTARAPFFAACPRPRLTPRDLQAQARRTRQAEPRAAMSGLQGRSQGAFVGARLAHLTVQPHRSAVAFTIQPHRQGSLTVE